MPTGTVLNDGNKHPLRPIAIGLCFVLLAPLLAACARGTDENGESRGFSLFNRQPPGFEEVAETDPAHELYNEGVVLATGGSFRDAAKRFEEVDRQHPYSELARKAVLMSAYARFEAGDYDGAVSAAQRYVTLHPGSPDAAYAQYIIGESYFQQLPIVKRDQEATERALQAMNDVIQKYPDSEYAEEARRKVKVAYDQLAGKEMEVGRFYMKQAKFLAAVNRFRYVVENYQTTRHVEEALHRLVESYLSLGVVHEAQTAAAVLGAQLS
jgi:outer membrane protein assembly factor BamD